jgi:hypothetical protein
MDGPFQETTKMDHNNAPSESLNCREFLRGLATINFSRGAVCEFFMKSVPPPGPISGAGTKMSHLSLGSLHFQ